MVERRIKSAKFPAVKSLDSFDFKAIPSLNKMMVLELARCEWIERKKMSSHSAHQAQAKLMSPSGWGWRPVKRGCRLASSRRHLWSMN